jgi:hypothetical protein
MGAFPSLNDRNKADRLIVVLGDQLDPTIGPVATATDDDVVLMMEVDEESTHVPSHKQRTALFLSAMRHFAVDQAERGRRVRYVELTDPHNTHSLRGRDRAGDRRVPTRVRAHHPPGRLAGDEEARVARGRASGSISRSTRTSTSSRRSTRSASGRTGASSGRWSTSTASSASGWAC